MGKADETKLEIAKSFKKLMKEKSFEQITITNITNDCGLSRLAFYYHFPDKYKLLNWIFYNEVVIPFNEGLDFDNWPRKLAEAMKRIKDEEKYYRNAFAYDNKEFLGFLFEVSNDTIGRAIDVMSGELYSIKPADKKFICNFFSYGVQGTINSWVQQGMPDSPKTITRKVKNLIDDSKVIVTSRYFKEITNKE